MIIFATHKQKQEIFKKTKTHLNKTMVEKTGTANVHVLTYFQNFC